MAMKISVNEIISQLDRKYLHRTPKDKYSLNYLLVCGSYLGVELGVESEHLRSLQSQQPISDNSKYGLDILIDKSTERRNRLEYLLNAFLTRRIKCKNCGRDFIKGYKGNSRILCENCILKTEIKPINSA